MAHGFSTRELADAAGLPASKIQSWARAGLLSPARDERGAHIFSFQDLVLLRSARELIDSKVPERTIRASLRALRQQLPTGRPLSAVHISAVGRRILARDDDHVWEPDSGQTLLDLGATPRATVAFGRSAAKPEAGPPPDRSADEWYDAGFELEGSHPERALAAYRSALAIDPLHADAHLNLGRLLHEAGDLDDAEAHYGAAAEAAPEDARARFNLGVLAEDRGRAPEAISAYREALRWDEHLAPAHFNLSRLLEARGEEAAALAHLVAYKRLISSPHP